MRILRSIHSLDPAGGGPAEYVLQSSLELIARGHDVEIVCLDRPDALWLAKSELKIHALGPGNRGYGYTPRFTQWLRDRHGGFDAVIVHGLWLYNSFGVWRVLRRARKPYYVFPHGMLDPWFNRAYPIKHLKKLPYWLVAERRVLRDAATVLFTSEEERRLAQKSFPFYRCNEAVVNYGIAAPTVDLSVAREDFLSRFPELCGKQLLVFLGRLHEKKGCDLLIESFADLSLSNSNLHLVMAGPCANEAYLSGLKELATQKRAPMSFTGMLRGNLKWGALRAADAFVLPSHQENFGIAVVEALACGTPVLISNQINIWREIEAHRAGYVEDDDLSGTTRLLEHWIGTSPEERETMRANARNCFAAKFEIKRAVDSLLSILRESIEAK
jgi:glycosyltransferase involved in cell wall biosynthesis